MIHFKTITKKDQENLKPYFFLPNDRPYKEGEILVLSIRDDESKTYTGEQIFYSIEKAVSKDQDKNIKAGVVFVNVKRIKNPLTSLAPAGTDEVANG